MCCRVILIFFLCLVHNMSHSLTSSQFAKLFELATGIWLLLPSTLFWIYSPKLWTTFFFVCDIRFLFQEGQYFQFSSIIFLFFQNKEFFRTKKEDEKKKKKRNENSVRCANKEKQLISTKINELNIFFSGLVNSRLDRWNPYQCFAVDNIPHSECLSGQSLFR